MRSTLEAAEAELDRMRLRLVGKDAKIQELGGALTMAQNELHRLKMLVGSSGPAVRTIVAGMAEAAGKSKG